MAPPKVGHEVSILSASSANASWIHLKPLTSTSRPLPRGRSRRNDLTVLFCSLSKFPLVNIFILLWNLEIQHCYTRVALQLFMEGILVHSYVAPKKSQLSYVVRSFSYFSYRLMWINSEKSFSKAKRKSSFLAFSPGLAQKGLCRVHPRHCLPTVPFPPSCCSTLAGKGARPLLHLRLRQWQQLLLWCSISPSPERELRSAELLNNQSHLRKIPAGGRIQNRCSEETYRGRDAGEEKKPHKERIKRGDLTDKSKLTCPQRQEILSIPERK